MDPYNVLLEQVELVVLQAAHLLAQQLGVARRRLRPPRARRAPPARRARLGRRHGLQPRVAVHVHAAWTHEGYCYYCTTLLILTRVKVYCI